MGEIYNLVELSNPVVFLDWLIEHESKIRVDERNKTIDDIKRIIIDLKYHDEISFDTLIDKIEQMKC